MDIARSIEEKFGSPKNERDILIVSLNYWGRKDKGTACVSRANFSMEEIFPDAKISKHDKNSIEDAVFLNKHPTLRISLRVPYVKNPNIESLK